MAEKWTMKIRNQAGGGKRRRKRSKTRLRLVRLAVPFSGGHNHTQFLLLPCDSLSRNFFLGLFGLIFAEERKKEGEELL